MRLGKAFAAFAASFFVLVFLRNGTAVRIIQDTSRGAQDVARGLRGVAKVA